MTRTEGLRKLNSVLADLEKCYATLDELYSQVSHPVNKEVRAKADDALKHSVNIAMMALNFKEVPQEAKKPFAAFLYTAADALSEDEEVVAAAQ